MRWLIAPVLVAALAGPAYATPINYAAPYVGGAGYIPTFGEVFTAQAGNTTLTSFSFYLQLSGTGPYSYSGYVYNWSGSAVTGSALYTGTGSANADGYYGFSPNLSLASGQSYIAMLSWATGWGEGLGCLAPNIDCLVNPSPNTQFQRNSGVTEVDWQNPALWTNNINTNFRIAFQMQLGDTTTEQPAAVPEPATLSLLGLGLGAASLRRLRRRKA